MELKIKILFLLLILPLMIIPVYGHDLIDVLITYHILDVKTDQPSYIGNNTMIVSGNLTDYGSSMISLILTSPNNGIVSMKDVISNGHGHYTTSMKLGNDDMYQNGTYTIIVKHNDEQAQTTMQYSNPTIIQNQIGLTTKINKSIFSVGETVGISGTANATVSIVIVNELKNLVSINQITPINGTYSYDYITGNSDLGTYKIIISLDKDNLITNKYLLIE